MSTTSTSVYDRLKALGISLPPVAAPAAAYLPFVQTGNLVFVSGHIARKDGKPWVGQLGKNINTEEGKAAARAIAIDLMGTLQAAVGDLGKVKRIVKLMSLVNSTSDFTEQHLVTNGASELLVEVFGDAGKHARSAFGVAQIPLGACRTWGGDSENRPQRGQFLPDLQAHSPAMGQEDGEKWTAAADLQPTIPRSDRLLGACVEIELIAEVA